MALPIVQQITQGASSAAAPATIAPTWAASQVGSGLVVLLAGALSGAANVTPPANWISGGIIVQGTTVGIWAYFLPGSLNPGGLTTATWTLINFNGVAWGVFEVPGLNTLSPVNTKERQTAGATSTAASTPVNFPIFTNQFTVSVLAILTGTAITTNNVPGRTSWVTGPSSTSTSGATNVILTSFYLLQGAAPLQEQAAYTLGASVTWAVLHLSFYSTSSANCVIGGDASQPYVQY